MGSLPAGAAPRVAVTDAGRKEMIKVTRQPATAARRFAGKVAGERRLVEVAGV